jgi:hypothetical protein
LLAIAFGISALLVDHNDKLSRSRHSGKVTRIRNFASNCVKQRLGTSEWVALLHELRSKDEVEIDWGDLASFRTYVLVEVQTPVWFGTLTYECRLSITEGVVTDYVETSHDSSL